LPEGLVEIFIGFIAKRKQTNG